MAGHIRCRSCRQERVHATVSFKITWRYSSQTNTSIWTQIKQSKWIACQKGNKIPSHQVRSSKKFQQTLLKTSSTSHVHQIWFPASTTIPWYGNIHSTLSLEKSKPNICNIMNASDECILWMHLMNASDECIWWMHLMNAFDECIWWIFSPNWTFVSSNDKHEFEKDWTKHSPGNKPRFNVDFYQKIVCWGLSNSSLSIDSSEDLWKVRCAHNKLISN